MAAGCNIDWAQFGYGSGNTRATSDTTVNQSNLARLADLFVGPAGGAISSSPAVAAHVAYVTSDAGTLTAFSGDLSSACSDTPVNCPPLWTATIQSPGTNGGAGTLSSSPAVSGGVVFVGSSDGRLEAFDAAGTTNCSGTPKVCTPLWTATLGGSIVGSPTVDGNVVYVGSTNGKFDAFDAAGTTNCSGTPKVCTPLWTATLGAAIDGSAAVAGGNVYVASADGTVKGFDAAGATNCSGTPTICTPLWTGDTGSTISSSSPAISGTTLYVGSTDGALSAFDTSGATGCTGSPPVCSPQWTMSTGGAIAGSPAVANGVVYVGSTDGTLYAADAAGLNGCTGTPTVCTPLWTAPTGGAITSSPAVGGSTVFVGSADHDLTAYDAAGTTNCTGTPKVCTPLWSATTGGAVDSSPAIANGGVYVGSRDGLLHAYRPWTFTSGNCASSPHGGISPCQLWDAYRLPSQVAGSGRTIAIVDAYDNPNAEADLAVYRSAYGLPPCTTANGCFTKLNQDGVAGSYPAANQGWAEEIALDLDAASAACPLCKLTLVEANSTSFTNLMAAEDTAAALQPTAISNSFGGSEFSSEHNYDSHFTHAGIATTVATGDGGYGTSWPATDPGVTAVGGTELSADTSARGWSETAWSGTESGCSTYEPKPTWQSDTGCANRTIADVSALAGSPYFAIYITYGTSTGWELFGGTSLAAPLIAAVYALAYPIVPTSTSYATTSSLFDVTAGSDGSCGGSYLCTALTGFDGPTGLGTPCGTAAFGTGPFGVADCVAGVTASAGTTTTAAPALAAPALSGPAPTPSCGDAPPGHARCFAERFGPAS